MSIQFPAEDPYNSPEERAEIGTPFFLRWTGRDGTWSTWRERHISIRAFFAGWRTGIMQDLPDCPAYWQDEGQYWDACAWFGNLARIATLVTLMNTAGGLAVLKLAGVI
jgi:hypothetical protein